MVIMLSTEKENCNIVADVLVGHGVNQFVISPGTRNAPLIVAVTRRAEVKTWVVVDERSAAFVALGIAQQSGQPVGLICTSGTAVLNYAPAVAEAFYQKIPLIVISADRPKEWIDQDDSQTINQFGCMSNIVKRSYNIPCRCDDDTSRWYVNRMVNDAVLEAVGGVRGPVHLNLEVNEPIRGEAEWECQQRIIRRPQLSQQLTDESIDGMLSDKAVLDKILIVIGFQQKNNRLQKILEQLAEYPNVAIITESIANAQSGAFIQAADKTLLAMSKERRNQFAPSLLITTGGALVSAMLKKFLRTSDIKQHWHLGDSRTTIDCFQKLTYKVPMDAGDFLLQISDKIINHGSNYREIWHKMKVDGCVRHNVKTSDIGWCDLKAFSFIAPKIPSDVRLQLSNGMTIRYAQLFADVVKSQTINCNRGVSGIDGSTSTAVGASLAYNGITLLITGDMSFLYDLSGLATQYNTSRFKIIVMANGGGGIFKFIKSTSDFPEVEQYMEVKRKIPVDKYAAAFGFKYFEANREETLSTEFPKFMLEEESPAILAIMTNDDTSAQVLRNYYSRDMRIR